MTFVKQIVQKQQHYGQMILTTTTLWSDDINISGQNKMNCELMLTYDTPALRQTRSRNLTDQKHYPQYGIPI
jgi:hypothetical protein